jgi:hypothetical protein
VFVGKIEIDPAGMLSDAHTDSPLVKGTFSPTSHLFLYLGRRDEMIDGFMLVGGSGSIPLF